MTEDSSWHSSIENSMSTRRGGAPAFVRSCVRRRQCSRAMRAAKRALCSLPAGMMMDRLPCGASKRCEWSMRASIVSVPSCLAVARAGSGADSPVVKKGGLQTMRSKVPSRNERKSPLTVFIRAAHGDARALAAASSAAGPSISSSRTCPAPRCAAISPIRPQPAPASRTLLPGSTVAHAPRVTPSVPTFMAAASWLTLNCLNLKSRSRMRSIVWKRVLIG